MIAHLDIPRQGLSYLFFVPLLVRWSIEHVSTIEESKSIWIRDVDKWIEVMSDSHVATKWFDQDVTPPANGGFHFEN